MDNKKEVTEIKTPIWANIASYVVGFILGILVLIQGVRYYQAANGGLGTIFLFGGLALVALGLVGLYFITQEKDKIILMKLSLAMGAVFSLVWAISFFMRSGSASGSNGPMMVIAGLVYLVGGAFLLMGLFRFKEKRATHNLLDFAFGGGVIIVLLVAASIWTNGGASGLNLTALAFGTILCCCTGLTTFYFGDAKPVVKKETSGVKLDD